MRQVGIIGAGVVGRLLAWHLSQQNVEVHLFDQDNIEKGKGCSWAAAAMISPLAERAILSKACYQMGLDSLQWWPKILKSLPTEVFYQANGTMVVCASQHKALLDHFVKEIKLSEPEINLSILDKAAISSLEPSLHSLIGCYLPNEACINPALFFNALAQYLLNHQVKWHANHQVISLSHQTIVTDKGDHQVDKIFDCRGLGATPLLSKLRGVRGEIVFCRSDAIDLKHVIRLLHARFPCYLVPQGEGIYAIGATQIEGSTHKNVSIHSALALLSAAVTVYPELREAEILELKSNFRPATLSHLPLLEEKEGVTYINGMFRHGFLLAPALTAQVAADFRRLM